MATMILQRPVHQGQNTLPPATNISIHHPLSPSSALTTQYLRVSLNHLTSLIYALMVGLSQGKSGQRMLASTKKRPASTAESPSEAAKKVCARLVSD